MNREPDSAEDAANGSLRPVILVLLAFLVIALLLFSSGWVQVDVGTQALPR